MLKLRPLPSQPGHKAASACSAKCVVLLQVLVSLHRPRPRHLFLRPPPPRTSANPQPSSNLLNGSRMLLWPSASGHWFWWASPPASTVALTLPSPKRTYVRLRSRCCPRQLVAAGGPCRRTLQTPSVTASSPVRISWSKDRQGALDPCSLLCSLAPLHPDGLPSHPLSPFIHLPKHQLLPLYPQVRLLMHCRPEFATPPLVFVKQSEGEISGHIDIVLPKPLVSKRRDEGPQALQPHEAIRCREGAWAEGLC